MSENYKKKKTETVSAKTRLEQKIVEAKSISKRIMMSKDIDSSKNNKK